MTPLICRIVPTIGLILQRAPGEIIGEVREVDGEPTIFLSVPTLKQIDPHLTFMDIKMIQETWNEFVERSKPKNPLDRFRFVDEKHP